MMRTEIRQVAMIDDNDDHAMLITELILREGLAADVIRFSNGESALKALLATGSGDIERIYPQLIFLDINLPGLNGMEVLERLKTDHRTSMIPMIMLTTSGRDEEIEMSYRKGASGFIVKPVRFDELSMKIRVLKDYWSEVSMIPANHSGLQNMEIGK